VELKGVDYMKGVKREGVEMYGAQKMNDTQQMKEMSRMNERLCCLKPSPKHAMQPPNQYSSSSSSIPTKLAFRHRSTAANFSASGPSARASHRLRAYSPGVGRHIVPPIA
jgi:hypothetical protein